MTINLSGKGGGGLVQKSQEFTSSGIWYKPEGVVKCKVLLVGGGGAGGQGYAIVYWEE